MSYGIRSHVKDVSDLAAKLIADLLAVVKRNEAFFKSRGQILVMVTPQDVKPWYFRFQQRVFCSVVSVINPVIKFTTNITLIFLFAMVGKGKYRRSGSAITIKFIAFLHRWPIISYTLIGPTSVVMCIRIATRMSRKICEQ